MSYQLNKTNGTVLVDLIDGKIDTTSTNLTLVGRGYRGYGEVFNENFIKLLENFSNTAAPSNPLTGQLWWDSANNQLKIYTGVEWKSTGEPFIQSTQPIGLAAGDFWFNNSDDQLYFFDGGGDPLLIGPSFTKNQGKTGFFVETIKSITEVEITIAKLYINNEEVGLFSNIEFTPAVVARIPALVSASNPNGIIFKGFNVYDKVNFKFIGIAESTSNLATTDGQLLNADQFIRSDIDSLTTGRLEIRNTNGLIFSNTTNTIMSMRPQGANFFIENPISNSDLALRVVSGANLGNLTNAVYIDASEGRVGIMNIDRLPLYTLDVEGDTRITGNLIVEGEQLSVEVTTLQVLDKSIKLAVTADGTAQDDLFADGGGIIVRSTQGDKTFLWEYDSNAWESNKDLNLTSESLSYRINGSIKLTENSLQNINFADDLVRLGTLVYLDVDNINIDGNTVLATGNLNLQATGNITFTTGGQLQINPVARISGIATPQNPGDAANKVYVDNTTLTQPLAMALDVTGIDTNLAYLEIVASYLEGLFPVESVNVGKLARIHTTSYSSVTINIETAKNISTVAVDKNGTENQPVVRDIAFNNIEFTNPNRQILTYEVQANTDPVTNITTIGWVNIGIESL